MPEDIDTLLREVDMYEGKKFRRKTTDLERFESLIGEEEVIDTIGDLDTIEEIARDIDSNLEGLLGSVEDYAKLKETKSRSTPLNPGPRKKRVLKKRIQAMN
jgi:hypothetical protein